ncbi:MAG: NusG domain II-containing protein [Thiohalospira sp.]
MSTIRDGIRHPRLGDWTILIAAGALVGGHWLGGPAGEGNRAEVRVEDSVVARLDLRQPGTYTIDGRLGTSVLEVADGAVRFVESACSTDRCIASGAHRHTGEVTACLPNRVTVAVRGGAGDYDTLHY